MAVNQISQLFEVCTWFLGYMSLCCIPFDIVFDFAFVIVFSTNRNHTLCLCGNIRRPDQTQHDTVGIVSRYLVGPEAARRKRLAFFEGAVFTELKAQGMNVFQNRPLCSFSTSTPKLNPQLICYQGC